MKFVDVASIGHYDRHSSVLAFCYFVASNQLPPWLSYRSNQTIIHCPVFTFFSVFVRQGSLSLYSTSLLIGGAMLLIQRSGRYLASCSCP
jgi:hypothetical protein